MNCLALPMSCPKGRTLFFSVIPVLLIAGTTWAQSQPKPRNIKLTGRFEGKNSFIRTHYALMLGGFIGVEFEKYNLQVGVGYEWLQSRFIPQFYDAIKHQGQPPSQPRMRFAHLVLAYRFYQEGGWEFSLPVQLGFGQSFYISAQETQFAHAFIMPLSMGIDINYFPLPLLGIGVGLGYRVMAVDNPNMEVRSDSPYYQTRLKIQFSELIKRLRKRQK